MSVQRILVLNGPNLDRLGTREPEIYGHRSLEEIISGLRSNFPDVLIDHHQSNMEGELIGWLHSAEGKYEGVVFNAGGYSHTSVSIRDAVSTISVPVLEVHISNLLSREPFRHTSLIGAVCVGSIMGLGAHGYALAIRYFLEGASMKADRSN